ncbi:MAG TPA: metallophosphoesterase [Actinomycetota bacterium]|nr:metallophosphoesterase [Actinomycetota bacterium]
MLRLAAVGDLHVGVDSVGQLRESLVRLSDQADVLLLAGDLTKRGELAEVDVLVGELRELSVPVVAVLGNHDHESDQQRALTQRLLDVGVRMLEGSATVLEVGGTRLGIAGGKGFGGGFVGACATAFGEREMKVFANASMLAAAAMESAVRSLDTDLRVLLTHYAPIRGTLHGESPELYPLLGSYLFAELADRSRVDLLVHGHAHGGTEKGATPRGIPVRNVAQPVLRRPYAVYGVEPGRHAASRGGDRWVDAPVG